MATARGLQNFMQAIGKSGGISSSNLYQFSFQPSAKLKKFFEDNIGDEFLKLTDNGDGMNLQLLCNEIQLLGVTYSALISSQCIKVSHKRWQQQKYITNWMLVSF